MASWLVAKLPGGEMTGNLIFAVFKRSRFEFRKVK